MIPNAFKLMNNITYRPARLDDINALQVIEAASFKSDLLSRRALQQGIRSQSQWIQVAVNEAGAPVGYCQLHFNSKTHVARLYSIAVLEAWRGRGIARTLIENAADHAMSQGKTSLVLEARSADSRLVQFYADQRFSAVEKLPGYYEDGADAIRMTRPLGAEFDTEAVSRRVRELRQIIVVVPREQDAKIIEAAGGAKQRPMIVTAQQFLALGHMLGEGVKVLNLCPCEEYLSSGYYVSLIAEARGNRTLPSIETISGLVSKRLYQQYLEELTRLLPAAEFLEPLRSAKTGNVSLELYFGQTGQPWARQIAKRCYQLFAAPVLEILVVERKGKWAIDYIWPLSVSSVDAKDRPRFIAALMAALNPSLPRPAGRQNYPFDLAILIDPDEKLPPSDARALTLTIRALAKQEIHAELIGKEDFKRLSAFDALYIRTTTNIDHYSYRFSRKAADLGLPVIDDPQSILRCSNKVFLAEALTRAGLDTPQTRLVTRANLASVAKSLPYPCVLKIPDGSFSRGMVKARNPEEFLAGAQNMLVDSFVILAQEFLPTDFDWRIGILDGKPIFACKYFMSRGHWQIYHHKSSGQVSSGGFSCCTLEEVPAAVLQASIRASLTIGDGLYGVDVKHLADRAVIIEVNDNPSIDAGIEDKIYGEAIYSGLASVFRRRILASKGISGG